MKRPIILLSLFVLPALAQDPAPAAQAPAPAAQAPAPAAQAAPATPLPGRVGRPGGPLFDALPEAEKEHIRKMAGFRNARDEAERELRRLGEEADGRKEAILAENEEAKKLHDRIQELKAEFVAATNALETIYREDEALAGMAGKVKVLQKEIESAQTSLNHEVATAMQLRMAAQRAAYEKDHPVPETPEARAAAVGMTPEEFTNLMTRTRAPAGVPRRPLGPLPGDRPVLPPAAEITDAPAPSPAPRATETPVAPAEK